MGIKGFTSSKTTVSLGYLNFQCHTLTLVNVQGKLRRTNPVHLHEFLSLKQHVSPEVRKVAIEGGDAADNGAVQDVPRLKITMCSPTWMHLRHGSEHTYDHAVYKNDGKEVAARLRTTGAL